MDLPFIYSYQIFLTPIVVVIITQMIKFIISGSKTHKWTLTTLTAYGGMPSTHTATVISLLTIVGISEGINSPLFGVVVIFAAITIRDAIGFRQFLSRHGKLINQLAQKHVHDSNQKLPHLKEVIGHTPKEALVGGLIGFFVTLILSAVWLN